MVKKDMLLLEAPLPVACIDSKMNFLNANKKFINILNLGSEEKIKGKPFSDFFESIDVLSLVERFIASKHIDLEYVQNILVDRKVHTYNFILKKIMCPDLVIAIYADDQTVYNEKKQELDALKNAMIATSRMAIIGEMAAGIAHEINNPLTVIGGLTDQITRSLHEIPLPEIEISQKLLKIKQTTDRMHKIVKGLKAHARNGGADPFETNFVKDIINDSLALCLDTLKSYEINLIMEDIDPAIELDCRGTQISQVLINLISNSKDAIKNQNSDRWIKISAKDVGNFVEFTLTDSGRGILPEVREKMLQPFFTTKGVGEGTGLGLSITKNIIDSHCGVLQIAENTPNTTFIFSIPKGLATNSPAEV
jgi:C4-dicarboxylate-specific signal transduction histidine kinase